MHLCWPCPLLLQIYELETTYLQTSNPMGNAIKGYEGVLRWFAWQSGCTCMLSLHPVCLTRLDEPLQASSVARRSQRPQLTTETACSAGAA